MHYRWLLLLSASWLSAGEFEHSGSLGVETRAFFQAPQFADQFNGFQFSAFAEPEFSWYSDDDVHQLALTVFARGDDQDDERSHFDVREAYWLWLGDGWELTLGVNRIFWGVTESRHLVNVINQIDAVENIDEEDFLGQPMVNWTLLRDFGTFGFFILPGFRERTFPGADGRLRAALPVEGSDAIYESGAEQWHVDYAVRYSHFIGSWDIGLSYFYGTGREPTLVADESGNGFKWFYELIHQGGVDVQYTRDAWLWKFEGLVREGQGDTFFASVSGFEYTFYQIFQGSGDLGILVEYLYDDRDEINAPVTLFQNDVFVGARWALNDPQDTSALLGAILDLEDETTSLRIEAERRLGSNFKIELELQWFARTDEENIALSFADDSFAQLSLTCYY